MARSRRITSALRLLLPLLVLAVIGLAVPAAQAVTTTTTTVSGVVTVDGRPAAGIEVEMSLPNGVTGSWPEAETNASGHYSMSNVQVTSGAASTRLTLRAEPMGAASHVVGVEMAVNVPRAGLTKNIALTTTDARLVATVTGIPAGTNATSIDLEAWQESTTLPDSSSYTAGRPIEIDGLTSAGYEVDVSYGDDREVYYPGTTDQTAERPLTLKAGCTTSLVVNLAATSMKVTGRDCSRVPACISAKGAATRAGAALTHDRKVLKKEKKKLKKAHKHATPAKKIKKLKKKVKKAKKVLNRAKRTASATAAAASTSCR